MGQTLDLNFIYARDADMFQILKRSMQTQIINQPYPPQIVGQTVRPVSDDDLVKLIAMKKEHLNSHIHLVVNVRGSNNEPGAGGDVFLSLMEQGADNRICISFFSSLPDPEVRKAVHAKYQQLVEDVIAETKPVFAFYSVNGCEELFFHYYADPFGFVAPVLEPINRRTIGYGQRRFTDALHHPARLNDIATAKQFLSRTELDSIIREHSLDVVPLNDSVGVWLDKAIEGQPWPDKFSQFPGGYPSFFIRRELRKRGAQLSYGAIEENLLAWIAFYPNYFHLTGLLDEQTTKKLTDINSNLSKETREELVLKILSKEQKHELGLDLPTRPPSEESQEIT